MRTTRSWTLPLLIVPIVLFGAAVAHAQNGAGTPLPFAGSTISAGGYPGNYPTSIAGYIPEVDRSYLAMAGAYGGMPGAPGPMPGYPGAMPMQGMPGGMPGMPGGMPGMQGGMPPYGVDPAAYQQQMGPGGGPAGQYNEGDYGDYCPDCGQGCRPGRCLLDFLLPYGEGGMCNPRWLDISVDYVNFSRDRISRPVDFASNGIAGPIVLGSNDLNFNNASGFKATAAYQVSPGGNVEFSFLGGFNFNSFATATSNTNNLYSALGNFGQNFIFAQTDAAFQQSLAYSSAFNSYELNYRRRWVGRDCRLQGSWLYGLRFFQQNEDILYSTLTGAPGFMNYRTGTTNSLTGFQIGGDSWFTIIPGLRIGAEAKVGVFGNRAIQNTSIEASSIAGPVLEAVARDNVAFVADFSAMGIYRIDYHWTFRAGYQLLYINGLALATENFNASPPSVFLPAGFAATRVPGLNNGGNSFYHGWTVGFEYMW